MPCPRRKRAAVASPAQTDFAALLDIPQAPAPTGATVAETPSAALLCPAAPFSDYIPVFAVKLVRTGSLWLKERPKITAPRDAMKLLQKHLHGADREYFVVVLLDIQMQVIGISTVSTGDLTSAFAHPREVFKPAILANAAAVLLAHNHPSGDPTPSLEDIAVTTRLADAGELLGITVVDHLVLGEPGQWVSLRERGLCRFPTGFDAKTGEKGQACWGAGLTL